jgi:flagellar biosynthesis protein FlhA
MVDPGQLGPGGTFDKVRAALKAGPDDLAEKVRKRLARQLCASLADCEGVIEVAELRPGVEDLVRSSLEREGPRLVLALRSDAEERLVRAISAAVDGLDRPVILCDPAIRLHVRRLVARTRPDVAVLARDEVHPAFRIQAVDQVSLSD